MNDRQITAKPSRLQSIATAMAASVFLLPVVLGKLFELILKSINPDDITGTGPGGRITRDDVLDFIDGKQLAPAAAAPAPAAAPAASGHPIPAVPAQTMPAMPMAVSAASALTATRALRSPVVRSPRLRSLHSCRPTAMTTANGTP